mgnify:FL=1
MSLSALHQKQGKSQLVKMGLMSAVTVLVSIFALGQGSSSNLDMWTTTQTILRDIRAFVGLPDTLRACGYFDGVAWNAGQTCSSAEDLQSQIIWRLRLPRVLMAILGGVALATAGALMQGCLGNPLVSPLTLGVASGASLGAALAIIVGFSLTTVGSLAIAGNAFVFSLIVVFIIIQLGRYRSVSAESYILVGIAITFIAGAIVSTLTYFATDAQLSQLAHWSFGSLARPNMVVVALVATSTFTLFPTAMKWSWDLNALSMGGDDFAVSTGVDPSSIRRNILILSALLTSLIIAFTGMIGFVGLAAPHMSRILIGNDYRKLLPASAICGAFLMLVADTIGRTLFAPVVIPVGIMLAVIGGPVFMYLLLQSKGVR